MITESEFDARVIDLASRVEPEHFEEFLAQMETLVKGFGRDDIDDIIDFMGLRK